MKSVKISSIPDVASYVLDRCHMNGMYTVQDIRDNGGEVALQVIGISDEDIQVFTSLLQEQDLAL